MKKKEINFTWNDAIRNLRETSISVFSVGEQSLKEKILETIEFKEIQLQEVIKSMEIETKKSKLKDLYKYEIEIKAQISILYHVLSK